MLSPSFNSMMTCLALLAFLVLSLALDTSQIWTKPSTSINPKIILEYSKVLQLFLNY